MKYEKFLDILNDENLSNEDKFSKLNSHFDKILEKKQNQSLEEFKATLPNQDEEFNKRLKEAGFESLDSIKEITSKYNEVVNERKTNKFNEALNTVLTDFNIDKKHSKIVAKLVNMNDVFENDDINVNKLKELTKSTIESDLKDIIPNTDGIIMADPNAHDNNVKETAQKQHLDSLRKIMRLK